MSKMATSPDKTFGILIVGRNKKMHHKHKSGLMST